MVSLLAYAVARSSVRGVERVVDGDRGRLGRLSLPLRASTLATHCVC
jgi:hypothetical protein